MVGKLFVLLAFICAFALSAEITFNSEWVDACSVGCNFFNSSIWINGTAPGANDTAIVDASAGEDFWLFIPLGINATVGTISLVNTQLWVFSPLSVNSIVLNASMLNVNSKVTLGSTLSALAGSNVTVVGGGITDAGTTQPANATFTDSLLWIPTANSSFWLNGYCYHSGQITLTFPNAYFCYALALEQSFAASGSYLSGNELLINGTDITLPGFEGNLVSVRPNSTATINGVLLWGTQMYLAQGSVLTLSNFAAGTTFISSLNAPGSAPVAGPGTLQILSSQVNITGIGSAQTFDGILELGGVSELLTANFATTHLSFLPVGANNDTTYITVKGNNLVLSTPPGDAMFPGEVNAYGKGVSLVGDFNIQGGGIFATDSSLTVNGSLIVPFTVNSFGANVSISLSGQIIVALVLDNTSSILVTGRTVWYGNLENNGLVRASSENYLYFNGNYNQTAAGTFYATVDSSENAPIRVYGVNNTLTLAGTLKFTTQESVFTSGSFLVAWSSNGTINGTFAGKALADSQSTIKTTTIEYSPYQVTLKYHLSPKDFPMWVWGVIGGGAALILIIIIALAVKCRRSRRPKYSPIP